VRFKRHPLPDLQREAAAKMKSSAFINCVTLQRPNDQPPVLISGIPGTGKSSLGRWCAENRGFVHIDAEHGGIAKAGVIDEWSIAARIPPGNVEPLVDVLKGLERPVMFDSIAAAWPELSAFYGSRVIDAIQPSACFVAPEVILGQVLGGPGIDVTSTLRQC
jgi:hypothetical protein